MTTFTVKAHAGDGRQLKNANNPDMRAWPLQLTSEDVDVPSSPVDVFATEQPSVGSSLAGYELKQNNFGYYLKRADSGAQTRSAASSGGGGRDDATGRSIERQAAAKATAELLAQRNFNGTAELVSAYDQVYDTVIQKIRGDA